MNDHRRDMLGAALVALGWVAAYAAAWLIGPLAGIAATGATMMTLGAAMIHRNNGR